MSGICGTFVELMGDPALGDIDRSMISEYRSQLLTLPKDLYQARRRHGVTSLADLISAVSLAGEPFMLLVTARRYIRRVSEMFNWAVSEGQMPHNPAAGVGDKGKKHKKDQDEREIFDNTDLEIIFGASWFRTGKGKGPNRAESRSFQPHYYWLPLLGLYTGGRLNELSQLHLNDVKKSETDCWYLDFNLEGSDKIEVGSAEKLKDKSLKNINSQRIVPIHNDIVNLGLPNYVQALREAGYTRLFPELRFDKIKGYGKAAGAWFNERYLGIQLRIPRDGKKTFHSFRHTFITKLFDKEIPESTIAQIAGHERGEFQTGKRYRKDQDAIKMKPYINCMDFTLPPIALFDVTAGVIAVERALDRKSRHPAAKV